jgi:hypothetical protein
MVTILQIDWNITHFNDRLELPFDPRGIGIIRGLPVQG